MNRLEIQKGEFTLVYGKQGFLVTGGNFYYRSHNDIKENMFHFDNDVSDSEKVKIRFEVLSLVDKCRKFVEEVF